MDTDRGGRQADVSTDDAPLDLAATAALIAEQRARVAAATDVDARILFGAWGLAWLIGYGLVWDAALDSPRLGLAQDHAGLTFGGLVMAGLVVTAVHLTRRSAGVRGTSATQGAMYGWAWGLSFAGLFALSSALGRAGVGNEAIMLAATIVTPLIVGALYMAGAAIWGYPTQFALGAWISVVTIVAAVVGMPHMLLVMSLAGGGGMLVTAGVDAALRRRSSNRDSSNRDSSNRGSSNRG